MAASKKEQDTTLIRVEAGFQTSIQTAVQLHADAALPMTPSAFRSEYVEALILLAKACDDVAKAGYERPILVGGAAVELHTGGSVTTGDFDFVSTEQQAFGKALASYGFRNEDRAGRLLMGWYHPEFSLGVQVVSGVLFDGQSDPLRVQLVEIVGGKSVAVVPVEDLIADRLGQFVAALPRPGEMRDQAIKLFQLATELDADYLDKRIRDETHSELGLVDLKLWSDIPLRRKPARSPGESES